MSRRRDRSQGEPPLPPAEAYAIMRNLLGAEYFLKVPPPKGTIVTVSAYGDSARCHYWMRTDQANWVVNKIKGDQTYYPLAVHATLAYDDERGEGYLRQLRA